MSKRKKVNTRWRTGSVRYPETERAELAKFSEQPGWHRGARVKRR